MAFRFANIGILWKVLSLLAMMSLVTISGTIYATGKMRYIDDTYGALLDGYGRGNLAVARANRDLVYVDRSIFRLLTESADSGKKQALQEINDTLGYFKKQIKVARSALPSKGAEIAGIGDDLAKAMAGSCANVMRLGGSANPDDNKFALKQMKDQCDSELNAVMIKISRLTNQILRLSDRASDDTLQVTNSTVHDSYIFILSSLAVIFALSSFVTKNSISNPIVTTAKTMSGMAEGHLPETVPYRDRGDEIGDMCRAVAIFLENEHDRRRLGNSEQGVRAREWERQNYLQQQMQQFSGEIGASVTALGDQTETMRKASAMLSSGAESVQRDARVAAEASSGAARNSQAVAAATVELEASIKEIAAQAQRASDIVELTAEAAAETDKDMNGLAEASKQIDSILDLIRTIAARTNLLALNATIEAARAGEAGRGFAVVAAEVKGLSDQTGKAVDEIAIQVASVQHSSGAAVAAIRDIAGKMAAIREMTQTIALSVEQQEEATREIARNVTLSAERSELAAGNVQAVSIVAGKTETEANQVRGASQSVAATTNEITESLNRFLQTVQKDLSERRGAWRQAVDVQVKIEHKGRAYSAPVKDVSVTGFKMNDPIGLKREDRIQVHLGGGAVSARVVWASGSTAGLRFEVALPSLPPEFTPVDRVEAA